MANNLSDANEGAWGEALLRSTVDAHKTDFGDYE
jgi:hypothetical protein